MTTPASQSSLAIQAFNSIISIYQELMAEGGLSPMKDVLLEPATSTRDIPVDTRKINVSEFLCDVELAAQRSLSVLEKAQFTQCYMTALVVPEAEGTYSLDTYLLRFSTSERTSVAERDRQIIHKLGVALIDRGIYPLTKYLA